jgi:hypothetical protein
LRGIFWLNCVFLLLLLLLLLLARQLSALHLLKIGGSLSAIQ